MKDSEYAIDTRAIFMEDYIQKKTILKSAYPIVGL